MSGQKHRQPPEPIPPEEWERTLAEHLRILRTQGEEALHQHLTEEIRLRRMPTQDETDKQPS